MMLFVLLLHSMGAPAAPPHPRPRGIFSGNDYPREAVIHHWEGTAIADLTIDATGHVTACEIVQSTGYKVLDDATCGLITKRALFKPSSDSNGKAIESKFRTPPINWRLPQ